MALAQQNRYEFQYWALGFITGRPDEEKKGADRGIDGYIAFFDHDAEKAKQIIVQVKSGHVTSSQIRDLKGTMERGHATIALFITLEGPTKPMVDEALTAGFYTTAYFPDNEYPRIQILAIKELLEGKKPQCPEFGVATFKKAPRQEKAPPKFRTASGNKTPPKPAENCQLNTTHLTVYQPKCGCC
jgi:site-specific DNA-methyltransferase (adenine-specific)